jgi:hypothetical protein
MSGVFRLLTEIPTLASTPDDLVLTIQIGVSMFRMIFLWISAEVHFCDISGLKRDSELVTGWTHSGGIVTAFAKPIILSSALPSRDLGRWESARRKGAGS